MKHQQDSIPFLATGASRTRRQPLSSSSSPPGRPAQARLPVRRHAQSNEAEFQNERTNMESPLRRSLEYHRECIRVIIDDALALIDDNGLSIHHEEQQDEEESKFSGEDDEEDAFSPDRPAGAPN